MYTWGPSHFLFQQYLKNVILCKGIPKKKKTTNKQTNKKTKNKNKNKTKKTLLTEQNNQNIVNCD